MCLLLLLVPCCGNGWGCCYYYYYYSCSYCHCHCYCCCCYYYYYYFCCSVGGAVAIDTLGGSRGLKGKDRCRAEASVGSTCVCSFLDSTLSFGRAEDKSSCGMWCGYCLDHSKYCFQFPTSDSKLRSCSGMPRKISASTCRMWLR